MHSDIFSLVPAWAWQPKFFFPVATVLFFLVFWPFSGPESLVKISDRLQRFFAKKSVAWAIAAIATLIIILGSANETFRAIISKGDNVPIFVMLYLFGFFTWLYVSRSVANDDRIAAGLPPAEEAEGHQKVMVWPDLVYIELICLVIVFSLLMIWSLVLKAPLEQPATAVSTPNPSKAPWYFLGLQEMLVYFDPWIAGVLVPGLVLVGLAVIPYIDINPKGMGYYTFKERRFAVSMFLYGFLIMWVLLIFVGTFLRGPNWNIFPLGEKWDIHKIEVLNNVNLSEFFWVLLLKQKMPDFWLLRELPGMIVVLGYFVAGPAILSRYGFKKMYKELGLLRYSILILLFLTMFGVVLKMVLRWSFNLKYFVAIPEYFFNI